jgi:molybdopterin-biosynthesis enzyme MoeA-like protein
MGVPVVREPRLVDLLRGFYRESLNEARLKMADVPEGAELVTADALVFPAIVMRNVYILPGVPEIFRQKFEALRERFRGEPFHLRNVFVSMSEGTLADFLNGLLQKYPDLLLGSYPEFSNPAYKVKVTLESRDPEYVSRALEDFLARLPRASVVRVE